MESNSKLENVDTIIQAISKLNEFICDQHQDQDVTSVITETLDKNELFKPVCNTCLMKSQS